MQVDLNIIAKFEDSHSSLNHVRQDYCENCSISETCSTSVFYP